MADETRRPSLKDSDATTDRDGQDLGEDSALGAGLPKHTQTDLRRDPGDEAQAARIASGQPGQDASEVTEAIERATAAVGQDDGRR